MRQPMPPDFKRALKRLEERVRRIETGAQYTRPAPRFIGTTAIDFCTANWEFHQAGSLGNEGNAVQEAGTSSQACGWALQAHDGKHAAVYADMDPLAGDFRMVVKLRDSNPVTQPGGFGLFLQRADKGELNGIGFWTWHDPFDVQAESNVKILPGPPTGPDYPTGGIGSPSYTDWWELTRIGSSFRLATYSSDPRMGGVVANTSSAWTLDPLHAADYGFGIAYKPGVLIYPSATSATVNVRTLWVQQFSSV